MKTADTDRTLAQGCTLTATLRSPLQGYEAGSKTMWKFTGEELGGGKGGMGIRRLSIVLIIQFLLSLTIQSLGSEEISV